MPALAQSPQSKSLAEQEHEIRRMEVAAARRSSAAFTSYVMRDEKGIAFKMAHFHKEWHRLLGLSSIAFYRQHGYLPIKLQPGDRLIIEGAAELGKSLQLLAYCAFVIGLDPTLRIVIVSKNKDKAAQLLSALVKVMTSPQYREVFPERTIQGFNVHTIRVNGWDGRNPTVQAYQFKGAPITGNRVDIAIFDDILDSVNTRTEALREEYFNFYKNTFISRLTDRGQVVFVSNSWHPRDLMHRLKNESGWLYRRYPIWENRGGGMVSIWPEHWPLHRIEQRRAEFADDVRYFERVYECIAIDDTASVWDPAWIKVAQSQGAGLRMVRSLAEAQGEYFRAVTIGVDLATCRPHARRQTDESAFVVTGHRSDGKKRLLCIEAGRLHGPQIVAKIKDLRKRFHPAIPWIETVAAQMFIADFCKQQGPDGSDPIPVRCFETTASSKYDPRFGVEALGTEMASGIHVFPHVEPGDIYHVEYQKLIQDMMRYDPGQHAGDRLMACVTPGHLVTTDSGLVPIELVKVGDQVLTHKGRFRTVTKTMSRHYEGEIVRITSGSQTVELTPEHPVWLSSAAAYPKTNRLHPKGDWSFVPARRARCGHKKKGDFLFAPTPKWEEKYPVLDLAEYIQQSSYKGALLWEVGYNELKWPRNPVTIKRYVGMDKEFAILCGLFIAEGSVGGNDGIGVVAFGLHKKELHLIDFVTRVMRRVFGVEGKVDTNAGNGVSVRFHSALAGRFFKSNFSFNAKTKSIPWTWMGFPVRTRLWIMRGWLMGDGCEEHDPWTLKGHSVSRQLIFQMQVSAREAGLLPSLDHRKGFTGVLKGLPRKHGLPSVCLPSWDILFSERDSQALLAGALPVEEEHWTIKTGPVRDRTNSTSIASGCGVAIKTRKIVSAPYVGDVYNMHVEEDESFVVESMAVHNCWISNEGLRLGHGGATVVQGLHAAAR